MRPQDAVGRFGGEEFLIVLGNCDRAAAARIAEEIRARVAAEEVEASGLNLPVTLSAGVATAVPAQAADPRALVHAANLALLRAKAGGRNRVETAAGT